MANYGHNCFNDMLGGVITDGGYNLDTGTDCLFSTANHSITGTDPRLWYLANNGGPTQTMALLPANQYVARSPAIDAIPTSSGLCPATDQRGVHRLGLGETACDIGAYEFVGTAADQVNTLLTTVNGYTTPSLPSSQLTTLDNKLQELLAEINTRQTALACSDLTGFISYVQAQTGNGGLTTARATDLIAAAQNVQVVLGC